MKQIYWIALPASVFANLIMALFSVETAWRKSLLRLGFFLRRRWFPPTFMRINLPFLVSRNRLAAPLWVFNFGIIASYNWSTDSSYAWQTKKNGLAPAF
jgi:hypothetical protein